VFGGSRLKKQHDDIPEVSISLNKTYRGYGIGTELMKRMLKLLKSKGYKKVSLAVQKDNYAVRMYHKAGFKIIDETMKEFIMEYLF
jgi:ribosomal protein S18 acetylase RimI-like enzyme